MALSHLLVYSFRKERFRCTFHRDARTHLKITIKFGEFPGMTTTIIGADTAAPLHCSPWNEHMTCTQRRAALLWWLVFTRKLSRKENPGKNPKHELLSQVERGINQRGFSSVTFRSLSGAAESRRSSFNKKRKKYEEKECRWYSVSSTE